MRDLRSSFDQQEGEQRNRHRNTATDWLVGSKAPANGRSQRVRSMAGFGRPVTSRRLRDSSSRSTACARCRSATPSLRRTALAWQAIPQRTLPGLPTRRRCLRHPRSGLLRRRVQTAVRGIHCLRCGVLSGLACCVSGVTIPVVLPVSQRVNYHWSQVQPGKGASVQIRRAMLIIAACLVPLGNAFGQPSSAPCEVNRQPFSGNENATATMTSTATMTLMQDRACRLRFRFGGQNPPGSWELVEAPKSGKVVFAEDFAEYQPDSGFSGLDKFVVAIFGTAPNCGGRCSRSVRYDVAVTVTPKP